MKPPRDLDRKADVPGRADDPPRDPHGPERRRLAELLGRLLARRWLRLRPPDPDGPEPR
jgi:hypothetical protein